MASFLVAKKSATPIAVESTQPSIQQISATLSSSPSTSVRTILRQCLTRKLAAFQEYYNANAYSARGRVSHLCNSQVRHCLYLPCLTSTRGRRIAAVFFRYLSRLDYEFAPHRQNPRHLQLNAISISWQHSS